MAIRILPLLVCSGLLLSAAPSASGRDDESSYPERTVLKGASFVVRASIDLPAGSEYLLFQDGKIIGDYPPHGAYCLVSLSHAAATDTRLSPDDGFDVAAATATRISPTRTTLKTGIAEPSLLEFVDCFRLKGSDSANPDLELSLQLDDVFGPYIRTRLP